MSKRGAPKKLIPPGRESEIIDAMVRGVTSAKLAPSFSVSPATMLRWMDELRSQLPSARKKAVEVAAPTPRPAPAVEALESGDDFGDATLRQIDEMLEVAKEKAETAASIGNADEHATYMRMVIALLEARRKATPPPKIDPNENPDMIALAKQGREKLHKFAEALVRVSNSPIADTIAGIIRPK